MARRGREELRDDVKAPSGTLDASAILACGDCAGGDLTGAYPNPTVKGIGAATCPLDLNDEVDLRFGSGNDARIRWSTGDASNHALVAALADANAALHLSTVEDIATDWNLGSVCHPTLYLHSDTNPATEYLRLGGHDGNNADIDLVGGTTLRLQIAGTCEATLTASALDLKCNQLLNVGAAGNDLGANNWSLVNSNACGTNLLSIDNSHAGASSAAKVAIRTPQACGGNAYITLQGGTSTGGNAFSIGQRGGNTALYFVGSNDLGDAQVAMTLSQASVLDLQCGTVVNATNLATLTGAQTLTNKTLTTPTIASFTNAQHDHSDAAGGGAVACLPKFASGTYTGDGCVNRSHCVGFAPKSVVVTWNSACVPGCCCDVMGMVNITTGIVFTGVSAISVGNLSISGCTWATNATRLNACGKAYAWAANG